jgi:hypothetical protein
MTARILNMLTITRAIRNRLLAGLACRTQISGAHVGVVDGKLENIKTVRDMVDIISKMRP